MDSYKNNFETIETQISSDSSNYSYNQRDSHYKKPSILKKNTSMERNKTPSNEKIVERNEKHKVVFKTPLLTQHEVENWKEYNVDFHEEGVCSCILF